MDLISVIIPVYNTQNYLKKCVESFLNQTYKNIEIILVDDGSTDKSPTICDEFEKKDKRVRVIHKINGGLSDARNVGISKSNGEYISFFDSDDYVDEDYISYLYSLVKKYNTEMAVCGYKVINENGKVLSKIDGFEESAISKKEFYHRMLIETGITVSACFKLYKKNLYDNILYPVGKLCEDNGTTYKVVDKVNGSIAYGNITKGYYVIHRGSIMRSKFSLKKMDMIELNDEMCDFLLTKYNDLDDIILRRRIYSRFNVLRQIDFKDENTKELMMSLVNYIKNHKKFILTNKFVPRRDKIACIILHISIKFFYFSWNTYEKVKYEM